MMYILHVFLIISIHVVSITLTTSLGLVNCRQAKTNHELQAKLNGKTIAIN